MSQSTRAWIPNGLTGMRLVAGILLPWTSAEWQFGLLLVAGFSDLIAHLPADNVGVWEDEVDIHLNPKIGLDWMVSGQQKRVMTPGQNVKRSLTGAPDVRTSLFYTNPD